MKKNYIQPEIKWITAEDNLMNISNATTDGSEDDIEVNTEGTNQPGGAKGNTWNPTSEWD
jgi:hypothetical protein